jgi:mannose-1-phosphate guanylyltransferase/phosphomannomutase
MIAVILAGGQGTRLGLENLPKSMVSIANMPLLEHQLLLLKRYEIKEVIILTGYLSEKIEAYFGNGSSWGINITYFRETTPLGTAGAIKQLEGTISDRFLVFYGDVVMDFDIHRFQAFDEPDSLASLIVHPNDHPYDSDLVQVEQCKIVNFISKPHPSELLYDNIVNAAVYILSPQIFDFIPQNLPCDFGKNIFPDVVRKGGILRAYSTPEYIKDLGTPDRLKKIEKDISSGKVTRWNRNNSRPAIFIDRDGVINREVDNLRRTSDFEILPNVIDAIREINQSDFLAIVVTNQPGISKGFLTAQKLHEIHKLLETQLGEKRAFVNHIYYCPHHPEKGFEGEVEDLKMECNCRKPAIGMILQAVEEYNIDISRSYFIGDSTTDILTAKNSALTAILVRTGFGGQDLKYDVSPDHVADDLFDAVNWILTQNLLDNDYFANTL